MTRFQVLSPYILAADEHNWPQVAFQFAGQITWTDVTGIPNPNIIPAPNLVAVEITAPDSVYDQIAADPNYFILWSEDL